MAARHSLERHRFRLVPSAYEDTARATETPHEQRTSCAASKTSVTGVTAIDDHGDLAGFLMGFDATPDPVSPMARYTPERSSLHLVAGHAVA